MTAIVGLAHDGRVHIAGDSAGLAGYNRTIRKDPKVFTHPQRAPGHTLVDDFWAIGYTTSWRMGQILRYHFTPPVLPHGTDPHHFLCTTFVDELRTTLKRAGWAPTNDGIEEAGQFLVGVAGRLFIVEADYQVAEPADAYAAVGCGAELAHGALHVTGELEIAPTQRLTLALSAAAHHSAGVAAPFTYVATTGEPPPPASTSNDSAASTRVAKAP